MTEPYMYSHYYHYDHGYYNHTHHKDGTTYDERTPHSPDQSPSSSSASVIDTMSITMACTISFVLFFIALGIVVWFVRDCREYREEQHVLDQLRKDEEEAKRNKEVEEKRKRAIHATIVVQKLQIDDNDNCTESITSSFMSSQVEDEQDHISTSTITKTFGSNTFFKKEAQSNQNKNDNDDDEFDENICSICLEPFYNHEELSWSKAQKCQHVFHTECLIPWLMKHEECPVCRTEFMTTVDFLDRTYCKDENNNENNDDENGADNDNDEEEGVIQVLPQQEDVDEQNDDHVDTDVPVETNSIDKEHGGNNSGDETTVSSSSISHNDHSNSIINNNHNDEEKYIDLEAGSLLDPRQETDEEDTTQNNNNDTSPIRVVNGLISIQTKQKNKKKYGRGGMYEKVNRGTTIVTDGEEGC